MIALIKVTSLLLCMTTLSKVESAGFGSNSKVRIISKSEYFNYVRLGENLILNVTLSFQSECGFHRKRKKIPFIAFWTKNGDTIATKGLGSFKNVPRITIKGEASLVIRNIKLEDNGTFVLEIYCGSLKKPSHPDLMSRFEVIVQIMPNVFSNCSDMTVYEGEDVICLCKTKNGNPKAKVSWKGKLTQRMGNSNGILKLKKISENQNGIYTCLAKSHDLVNNTSFNLRVIYKKALIKSFKIAREIGARFARLLIICNAEGIPAPTYVIKHNGTKVKVGNILTVNEETSDIPGLYECLAKNKHGIARSWLHINARIRVNQGIMKEGLNDTRDETEWYTIMISVVSAFIAGILSRYITNRIYEIFRGRSGHPENSTNNATSPEAQNQQRKSANGLGTTEYEELDLVQINRKQYQKSPKMNSELRKQLADESESTYQELNQLRENESERYQSLIRARERIS